MNIHKVKPQDKDYPMFMMLVPNADKYELISIDGDMFVRLFEVLDAIMVVKPDIIVKNGKRFCANCGKAMEEGECNHE